MLKIFLLMISLDLFLNEMLLYVFGIIVNLSTDNYYKKIFFSSIISIVFITKKFIYTKFFLFVYYFFR